MLILIGYDELERFFTERYRQYLDSIKKTDSRLVIKDLITGDSFKQELSLIIIETLLENKVILKDSVINNLNFQINNFNSIL